MKNRYLLLSLLVLTGGLIAAACGEGTPSPQPTQPPPAVTQPPISGSVSQGGRLYDKWWSEASVDAPTGDQPLWASQTTNTRSGGDTWRCKECHGWDYLGADGAYGSGSHFTGFPGVFESVASMTPAELLAALDGSASADHDFSAMGEEALGSLVVFLGEGLVDIRPYIDADTKAAIGADLDHGAELYVDACSACHGTDGRALNFSDPDDPEYVGTIALTNPWEFIHKVRAGQPGTGMPSAIDSGWNMQDVVDVLGYAQTFPTQPPALSQGGRLYDKWWTEAGVDQPAGDMPLWASQTTNTRSGGDTWRCKECHGWDYMGAEGAYGTGSHFTGFPGVYGASELSLEELVAQLDGSTDANHDFSLMGEEALTSLAAFLRFGLVEVAPYIDPETKAAVGGDATLGETLFATTCAVCHGDDGRTLNFGDEEDPEYVATIALDNPWEFIHKVRAGQPGTGMPSSIDLGWVLQDVVNLLSFAQTLPAEAP